MVASGYWDATVRLWDGASGAPLCAPVEGLRDRVRRVALCTGPDGRLVVASNSAKNTVRLWDGLTGTLQWVSRSTSQSLDAHGLTLPGCAG